MVAISLEKFIIVVINRNISWFWEAYFSKTQKKYRLFYASLPSELPAKVESKILMNGIYTMVNVLIFAFQLCIRLSALKS